MTLEDEIKKEVITGETPTKLAYEYLNAFSLLEELKKRGAGESDSKYKEINEKLGKAQKKFIESIKKYGIEIKDPETALGTYLNGRGAEAAVEHSVKGYFNTLPKQMATGRAIVEYELGISADSPKKKEKTKGKSLLDELNVRQLKEADIIKIITTDLDEMVAGYHQSLELLKNPQYRELNKDKMKDIKKAVADTGKELKEYLDKVFAIYGDAFKGLGEVILEDLQHQGLEGGTLEWVGKLVDRARSRLYESLNGKDKSSVYKAAFAKRLESYKPRPRPKGGKEE